MTTLLCRSLERLNLHSKMREGDREGLMTRSALPAEQSECCTSAEVTYFVIGSEMRFNLQKDLVKSTPLATRRRYTGHEA